MSVRVAVTQYAVQVDIEANISQIRAGVDRAVEEGADLCVFPENSMWTDPTRSGLIAPAQFITGPFVQELSRLSNAHGVHIVFGMSEKIDDGDTRYSNTLVHLDRHGAVQGTYSKVHLFDAFGVVESKKVRPGPLADPYVFKINDLTFGMMTCYDVRFPESARRLVDAGANALLVPSAWGSGPMKEVHWELLSRARAIENTVYVVASSQTAPTYIGQSQILDPMGVVVAGAGEEPGTFCATLRSERIEEVRRIVPCLANRRFQISNP
ncbi:hypothetical protein BTO20_00385 [Mycobacterium dioxanotrophicus]|uniref:CN hydrolase domain-containing protein n=1 Tax=Mycobacterium dioxanotrophicus TaxID=482462 RepID=A0A1Y0BWL0_9MYCO|nr:carbon-nitrogen hydrolase family protein [Mycobacterium dioxanotrophicus]ART67282.1 hypothetical protein BTO20_00385 [Mycobacterium dioxanotrophicus]